MSEMMRVLIGYDGSPASDEGLDDLKWAGLPGRLEAIVVTAADVVLPAWPNGEVGLADYSSSETESLTKQSMERARFLVDEAKERLTKTFPLWKVKAEVHGESPTKSLLNRAHDFKPDLIVLGAHGHSRLGRFIGSVSQLTLVQAPCSVRIGRSRPDKTRSEIKVVLAVDGSEGARRAVEAMKKRQWPSNTRIHVVCAIGHHLADLARVKHLVPPEIRWINDVTDAERANAGRMAEAVAKQLRNEIPNVSITVHDGEAKKTILNEAELTQADCIFMGARSLSSVKRFLIGGVSLAVAARAHCSVEVIR